MIRGRVHSIQSLGTLDGPGVRFVVFMQGCNLRCGCCHNPDTWSLSGGSLYTADEIFEKAERFKEYFGKDGGITLSGGEPLLQSDFAFELFSLCKAHGVNTCLDTSGSIINDSVKRLLTVTDRVLLDIKYTTEEDYKKYVGCDLKRVINFLSLLDEKGIATTVRQVIIPSLNDTENNIFALKDILKQYSCIDKTELLPFKKICQTKYDSLGISFPFAEYKTPSNTKMQILEELLSNCYKTATNS